MEHVAEMECNDEEYWKEDEKNMEKRDWKFSAVCASHCLHSIHVLNTFHVIPSINQHSIDIPKSMMILY